VGIIYPQQMAANGEVLPLFGTSEGRIELPEAYLDFAEVFSEEGAEILAQNADYNHIINI